MSKSLPGVVLALLCTMGCHNNDAARAAVFGSAQFGGPIRLDPGEGDRAGLLEYARSHQIDNGLLETLYSTNYRYADKRLVSLLVANGFSKVECVTIRARYRTHEECFLMHTPKVHSLDSAAHRQLVSVDFENDYEGAPLGVPMKFHSLTFTYRIVSDKLVAPMMSTNFSGQATTALSPETGKWEIMDLKLNDAGESALMDRVLAQYAEYDPHAGASALSAKTRTN